MPAEKNQPKRQQWKNSQ